MRWPCGGAKGFSYWPYQTCAGKDVGLVALRVARFGEPCGVGSSLGLGTAPALDGYEGVDVDVLGGDLAESFLRHVLRPETDTRVIGFKEIRWHEDPQMFLPMLEFLIRYLPGARFVFNTRDHAEVCRSGWWKTMERAEVIAQLEQAEAQYQSALARFPDRCLKMHYNT